MKSVKKIISYLMIAALVLTIFPFGGMTGSAASNQSDASLVLNRPAGHLIVSEITRVAYSSNSMKAPTGTNSVIVQATPSGIPYLSSAKRTVAYAGETPTSTTVVFTPGVELDSVPVLSCNNSTVKWNTTPAFSNGTYSWTVTGGSASVGSTLIFTVTYSYSEVNPVSQKTYTNTYTSCATSYVEAILCPPGIYSSKRTYEDWGLGTTTKNRSYVASFLLGKNTYGSIYNDGTPDGSVDFVNGSWTIDRIGWTDAYGIMKSFSGSDASRYFNVAYKADSNRPMATVYFDKSICSTLSDINLRAVTTNLGMSDESDERVTITMRDAVVNSGFVATSDDNNSEFENEDDPVQAAQLNITVPSTSLYAIGSFNTAYFTGPGPSGNNGTTDYTLDFHYQTAAGWNEIYVDHSYNLEIITYDKGALRTLVENVEDIDPETMTTDIPQGGYKGYNPQPWYFSNGWDAFCNELNSSKSCLEKPNVTQDQIDAQYNELLEAYNNLQMKKADYTAAGAYYNQAIIKNPNNYTYASWARVQTILDSYCSNYSVLYQPAVDKLAADLKAALEGLEERYADYSVFLAHVTTVNNLMRNAQTVYGKPASEVYDNWSNLESVLRKSGCTYNELDGYTFENYLLISDQPTVNGYVLLIENALELLRIKSANYTNAFNAEAAYRKININYVVPDIAENLRNAYNALVALHGLDLTRQADVDNATILLNYWLSEVEYKPVNTAEAEALIAYANGLDRTLYSDFSGVDSAIQNLQSKFSLDIRYQNEVTRAMSALQSAIDRLLTNSADYSQVNAALENMAEIERSILETYEDSYGFTAPTFYSNWSAVTEAAAGVTRGLDITYQSLVDSYAVDINNALSRLKENAADYSQVNTLQTQAGTICSTGGSIYTQASLDNLQLVYMNVTRNLPISSQSTVDGYAAAIQQAIDSLEYLPANYSNYNAQLASANQKIAADDAFSLAHPGYSLYTSESLAGVRVAIAESVDGLDIRQQSAVDGYTSALSAAISQLEYAPADYTAVNEVLTRVPEDLSDYTALTATSLTTYIGKINYTYTADKQSTVDGYVSGIENLISKLKLKSADYTAVNNAVNSVPYDHSNYTDDSWQAVQDQINAVVTGLDITHQDEVDAMAENILIAISYLAYKSADYSAVDEAKSRIPVDLSNYTDTTVAALETVLDSIDYYCNITQQTTVNGYVSALNMAINNLRLKNADYSSVQEAITNANAKINTGLYSQESVEAVRSAINAVVYSYNITRQDEVYAFAQAINTAAGAMQYKGADYSAVNEAIANANTKINSGLYTDESVAAVQAKIDAVVTGLDITHQDEVTAMAQAINTAAGAMQYKGADYNAVNEAIANANTKINSGLYTDESVAAVQAKIDAVVTGLDITHQDEVTAMAQAINTAAGAMQYKGANYNAVNEAVANANTKINSGLYTDESVAAVQAKIEAVVTGLDITHQDEVTAMAQAINTAAGAMQYKGADYSELDEAIRLANEKIASDMYTDESVAALQTEIAKKVPNLDISHQDEIDSLKESIVKATKNLALKLANYTELQNILNLLDNSDSEIYTITYTNFNDVMSLIAAYRTDVVENGMELTIDRQSEVDEMAETLQGYIDSLIPAPVLVESYEFIGGAASNSKNYVYGFKEGLTSAKLLSTYFYGENVTAKIKLANSTRLVGTGSVITITSDLTGEVIATYTVIIYGDVDGNGKVEAKDEIAMTLSYYGEGESLTGAALTAANLVGTRVAIDASDIVAIDAVIAGQKTINQTTGKAV